MKPLEEINKEAAESREEDLMSARLRGVADIANALEEERLTDPVVSYKMRALISSRRVGSMSSTRPTVYGTLCSIIAGLCRRNRELEKQATEQKMSEKPAVYLNTQG